MSIRHRCTGLRALFRSDYRLRRLASAVRSLMSYYFAASRLLFLRVDSGEVFVPCVIHGAIHRRTVNWSRPSNLSSGDLNDRSSHSAPCHLQVRVASGRERTRPACSASVSIVNAMRLSPLCSNSFQMPASIGGLPSSGGLAGHSASRYVERPTTVGWSSRSVSTFPSPNNRRHLRGNDDRNFL